MTEIVVSDAALGDADGVFAQAVAHFAVRFGPIRPLDPSSIPGDRSAAIAALDEWARDGVGNWRLELVRFYEAHAPQALRPDPALNALLRRAARNGRRITVVSPLPRAAVELYLSHLGVRRAASVVLGEEDPAPATTPLATRSALDAALADREPQAP